MSTAGWRPGDPWVCCDICGKRVRISESRKTWDGLRVCQADFDPKHPLLSMRSKPDRQAVFDGRPEPPDKFVTVENDIGSFCLRSPNGTYYAIHVADDGAWIVTERLLGVPLDYFHLGGYKYGVDNDGNVNPIEASPGGRTDWHMVSSPSGLVYAMNAGVDGSINPTYAGTYPPWFW
jgi:hypothetical protein